MSSGARRDPRVFERKMPIQAYTRMTMDSGFRRNDALDGGPMYKRMIRRSMLPLALAALIALPAHAADMNKVLRVGFPVDVTGFDPQAQNDLYSNHINRVVF